MFCCSASKTQSFRWSSSPEWQESGVNMLGWWSSLSPGNKHFASLWARASPDILRWRPVEALHAHHYSSLRLTPRRKKKRRRKRKRKSSRLLLEVSPHRFDRVTHTLMEFAHNVARLGICQQTPYFSQDSWRQCDSAPSPNNHGDKRKAITSETFLDALLEPLRCLRVFDKLLAEMVMMLQLACYCLQ